jgi:CheY-like chemotaxis protein
MLGLGEKQQLPTVLLIDDDMVSREVLATVLTMGGYTVHTAAAGEAALELLAARECLPEVILMDAQMPGASGTHLIEELRAHTQAAVVAISGSNAPAEILAAADGFLLKPFGARELSNLLNERQPQSRPPSTTGEAPDPTPNPDFALPVISPETLAQLRSLMPEPALRKIFAAIVKDLNERLEALEAALAKGDTAEVRRIGHAIKGGCGMAGALQAARLGARLEALREGPSGVDQLDDSRCLLADLRLAASNLERMLEGELPASQQVEGG